MTFILDNKIRQYHYYKASLFSIYGTMFGLFCRNFSSLLLVRQITWSFISTKKGLSLTKRLSGALVSFVCTMDFLTSTLKSYFWFDIMFFSNCLEVNQDPLREKQLHTLRILKRLLQGIRKLINH